jgi:hypothetical protein
MGLAPALFLFICLPNMSHRLFCYRYDDFWSKTFSRRGSFDGVGDTWRNGNRQMTFCVDQSMEVLRKGKAQYG